MPQSAAQQTVIQAERQRKLQPLTFAESSILSRDLPRDTILKSLLLRLNGAIQTTYASGSPVADAITTLDALIPRVDIIVNGSRTVKSVRPYIQEQLQLLSSIVLGERKASAGAAALSPANPTADGGFVFGTTTQYTTVAETVRISFQDQLCRDSSKNYSLLNLKNVASAELRLTTAAGSKLQTANDATSVTYAYSNLIVDIYTIEAQHAPAAQKFADLKQTTKEITFSAQVTEQVVEINRGNMLRGMAFLVRNGDAAKSLSNNAVSDIKLVVNGQQIIKASNFQQLQAEIRAKFGVSAAYSSNVSRIDGFAFMDLLQDGDPSTALDVSPAAGVDNVQLLVSTAASGSGATYTNPVSLTVETQEIVMPR